ncbi:hypothetical protein, unknown function [Leishmania infantum JPCM5]|uniref:Uncharacterized protein n=2 Tax=Leishmania infantum TaxID=5671 RepID=A4I0I4_LEIIN|nr:hypothetical protein, unknown function [Leishmania infantum JPCM5]CAC9490051.1 hypothetical_protein_-_conserved [Leishmania infantum]CAM68254.1 hypothetical protein, unknown function [Leishmania infantum JPCM5]SUZ42031.1 hypothetical_protein_-_conserved [Leishmania infantum]|eukprot:XP_001465825.1 hypothetical protein, unknown function [Leishmania infantum JPCM5]
MALYGRAIGALRRHQDGAIGAVVLALVLCVCVPLLAVVPESRPYGATFIAWALAFAVRAWRCLPRERAHVRRAAHRLADARMRQRGVGKVLMPYTEESRLMSVARYNRGNRLPSCSSTEARTRCRGFLAIGSRSPTPTHQARVGMGHNGISANSSGTTNSAAAASAPLSCDLFLSTSALESSAQFLALTHVASRQEPSWSIADRHAASITPSGSRSGSGRRTPRRSHEPFTYVSRACASDFTTLSEHGSEVPSVEPASPSSMQPTTSSSSRTHGCTGAAMTPASLPQTPVVSGAVQSPAWLPAEPARTFSDSKTPLSVCSQPSKVGSSSSQKDTLSPPTYEEAVLPSSRSSSSPRIAVLSATMRLQRLSPAVTRDGAP